MKIINNSWLYWDRLSTPRVSGGYCVIRFEINIIRIRKFFPILVFVNIPLERHFGSVTVVTLKYHFWPFFMPITLFMSFFNLLIKIIFYLKIINFNEKWVKVSKFPQIIFTNLLKKEFCIEKEIKDIDFENILYA